MDWEDSDREGSDDILENLRRNFISTLNQAGDQVSEDSRVLQLFVPRLIRWIAMQIAARRVFYMLAISLFVMIGLFSSFVFISYSIPSGCPFQPQT